MQLKLTSFTTTDSLELPGILFQPSKSTEKIFIWLHGMGDSGVFYSQARIHALASALSKRGIAFFPFNNRGAYNSKTLRRFSDTPGQEDGSYQAGTYYEKIADCKHDIDGAVAFLKQRGYREFYLGGHSTGANKICVYDYLSKHTAFSKYVLAGPGDDSGLFYCELGDKRFHEALSYAKQTIKLGHTAYIMPKYSGMYPFSVQSAADILDPDGDYNTFPLYEKTTKRLGQKELFREYGQIVKPMLVVYGENDEYTYTGGGTDSALRLFEEYTSTKAHKTSDFITIPAADHGFHGQENVFATKVADWLAS